VKKEKLVQVKAVRCVRNVGAAREVAVRILLSSLRRPPIPKSTLKALFVCLNSKNPVPEAHIAYFHL
jgi:hypothetical protein